MASVVLAALVVGAHGAVAILLTLLIWCLIAALVYWVLSLFAPHPIPAIAAAIVVVVGLIAALG